ncbi:hypothetical protein [Comamonas kerstersii]|uniref:hypothetical protein n=1 Tax=Comamonas kerstersii TaxID=225992 RepID=UPI00266C47A9|nr:hypothetical protein [Comamonas kerstersii]
MTAAQTSPETASACTSREAACGAAARETTQAKGISRNFQQSMYDASCYSRIGNHPDKTETLSANIDSARRASTQM